MVVEQFIPVETTPAFFFGDLSELEAMRLLVTAGTGQIGAALVPRLASLGTVAAPNRLLP